jgi:hypothetical protein
VAPRGYNVPSLCSSLVSRTLSMERQSIVNSNVRLSVNWGVEPKVETSIGEPVRELAVSSSLRFIGVMLNLEALGHGGVLVDFKYTARFVHEGQKHPPVVHKTLR